MSRIVWDYAKPGRGEDQEDKREVEGGKEFRAFEAVAVLPPAKRKAQEPVGAAPSSDRKPTKAIIGVASFTCAELTPHGRHSSLLVHTPTTLSSPFCPSTRPSSGLSCAAGHPRCCRER